MVDVTASGERTRPLVVDPELVASRASSRAPAGSQPTTPTTVACEPSAITLAAGLAAEPARSSRSTTSRIEHRRLARDARRPPGDVLVQHQVADHQDAPTRQPADVLAGSAGSSSPHAHPGQQRADQQPDQRSGRRSQRQDTARAAARAQAAPASKTQQRDDAELVADEQARHGDRRQLAARACDWRRARRRLADDEADHHVLISGPRNASNGISVSMIVPTAPTPTP